MRIATQFSVFLINKPGVLAQVISAIAEAKVNIEAMTVVDAHEHGVMRLVVDRPELARPVLAKLNLPTHESEVLAVELGNQAGALAAVLRTLAQEHIDIDYAYVTAGAPGGKTTGILHVNQPVKAAKLLENKAGHGDGKATFRAGRSQRSR